MYKFVQKRKQGDRKKRPQKIQDNAGIPGYVKYGFFHDSAGMHHNFPRSDSFGALAYTRQPGSCAALGQGCPIQFTKEESVIRIKKLLNEKNKQGTGNLVLQSALNALLQELQPDKRDSLNARRGKRKAKAVQTGGKGSGSPEVMGTIHILNDFVDNEDADPWAVLEYLPESQIERLESIFAENPSRDADFTQIYHVGFDNLTEKYFTDNFKKNHFASSYEQALKVSSERNDTRTNTVLCEFQRNNFMQNEYKNIEKNTSEYYTTSIPYYYWQFVKKGTLWEGADTLYRGEVILSMHKNPGGSICVYHLAGIENMEDAGWSTDNNNGAMAIMRYLCEEMQILAEKNKKNLTLAAISAHAREAYEMLSNGQMRNESVMADFFGQTFVNFFEASVTYSKEDFPYDEYRIPYWRSGLADLDQFLGEFGGSLNDDRVKKYYEIHGKENIYMKMLDAFDQFVEKQSVEGTDLEEDTEGIF